MYCFDNGFIIVSSSQRHASPDGEPAAGEPYGEAMVRPFLMAFAT